MLKDPLGIRLEWEPVYHDSIIDPDMPHAYLVWRRPASTTDSFVRIGEVPAADPLKYVDTTTGAASWAYEVTAVY